MKKKFFKDKRKIRGYKEFLYILPFLILVLVFSYYPLYGWIYAFFDYQPPLPFSWDSFVGLKWFRMLFQNKSYAKQTVEVLRNTFAMSGISFIFSWVPMFFAIMLNEVTNKRFRKFVQTSTTFPNFISWILVYSVAFLMLSNSGLFNSIGMGLGIIDQPVDFLKSGDNIWFKMWLMLTWKNAGWTAIIYLSAIAGIDTELYEAAEVDGANRRQIIRYITLPGLMPTFFVILILNISNFLNTGFEQYFVFQNAWNREYIQVLDLYTYNLATSKPPAYSISVALSMLKSIVSVVLLVGANTLSKVVRDDGII